MLSSTDSFRAGAQAPAAVPRVGARPLFLRKDREYDDSTCRQISRGVWPTASRTSRCCSPRSSAGAACACSSTIPTASRSRCASASRSLLERPARALLARGLLARQRAAADQARALPPLRRAPRARAHAPPAPGGRADAASARRRAAGAELHRRAGGRLRAARSRSPPTGASSRSPTRRSVVRT